MFLKQEKQEMDDFAITNFGFKGKINIPKSFFLCNRFFVQKLIHFGLFTEGTVPV